MINRGFKAVIISFLLIFSLNNILYSESKALVREIIAHENDSVFKYSYFFDDNKNKVVENKYYVNESNVSYPLLRTEWIYDTNNCVQQRKQKWQEGNWETTYLIESEYVNNLKFKEKYTAVSNKVERIEKTIVNEFENGKLSRVTKNKGADTEHIIDQSTSYNYDNANRVSSMQIDAEPDRGNKSQQKLQYMYNQITGKLDSLIYQENKQGEITDRQLSLFFYDKNTGNLMSQVQKKWNDKISKWGSETKSEFTYNSSGKLVQEIYSGFGGYFWNVIVRYDYVYDHRGLLQSKVMYQPLYRQWRKIYTIEYSNIENDRPNLMESKYNFWGGNTGEYVNSFIPYYFNDEISIMEANRIELKYTTDITVVTNSSFESDLLKIYPNPSNGVFYINTQNYYIESWEVYNVNGIRLKGDVNRFRTGVVDLTELPDGIYMIKAITSDDKLLKQKIIINRNQ